MLSTRIICSSSSIMDAGGKEQAFFFFFHHTSFKPLFDFGFFSSLFFFFLRSNETQCKITILSGVDGGIYYFFLKKTLRNKDGNVGVAERRLPSRGTLNVTQYLDICLEKNESERVL